MAVALLSFSVVAGLILIQQQREVSAQQVFQMVHEQVLAEQAHAMSLGLEPAELAPFQHEQAAIASSTPPAALPLLNEGRIGFYIKAWGEELRLWQRLRAYEDRQHSVSRAAAESSSAELRAALARATELGMDDEELTSFTPITRAAHYALDQAATVAEYRRVTDDLQSPLARLRVLLAEQKLANARIGELAAQAAEQHHGDAAQARSIFEKALSQLDTDLQTAKVFQVDASAMESKRKRVVDRATPAATTQAIDQLTGTLLLLDRQLQESLSVSLPEKAITISLDEQVLRAYEYGQQVWSTYITTGRPGLETDPGRFKVYWKVTPWVMQSPWAKPDPRWYPDSPVKMVMWFNGASGIHDAPWRAHYGPGTQYNHYDPLGANTGTHGCVNLPPGNMTWLWNWTPTGTPVIVY